MGENEIANGESAIAAAAALDLTGLEDLSGLAAHANATLITPAVKPTSRAATSVRPNAANVAAIV